MTPTEFLRKKKIIAEDKTDLIIGFDNGTKESLIDLLEKYHEIKMGSNIFRFAFLTKDGDMKTKTIEALNIENAKIIFEAKYPDYQYDEPY